MTESSDVAAWINRLAHPLTTTEARAPLDDLTALADAVGEATVVGVARPAHGAHELSTLTHRILRVLVEHRGFRTLALETDMATGARIDAYVRSSRHQPPNWLDGWATTKTTFLPPDLVPMFPEPYPYNASDTPVAFGVVGGLVVITRGLRCRWALDRSGC